MATITKRILSGSSNGLPIAVCATGSLGNTIHTALTSTNTTDEIWIYAQNNFTSVVSLVIEYGSTASNASIKAEIPPLNGITLLMPGLPLVGVTTTAPIITAYASTSNVVSLSGFVNRMVQS